METYSARLPVVISTEPPSATKVHGCGFHGITKRFLISILLGASFVMAPAQGAFVSAFVSVSTPGGYMEDSDFQPVGPLNVSSTSSGSGGSGDASLTVDYGIISGSLSAGMSTSSPTSTGASTEARGEWSDNFQMLPVHPSLLGQPGSAIAHLNVFVDLDASASNNDIGTSVGAGSTFNVSWTMGSDGLFREASFTSGIGQEGDAFGLLALPFDFIFGDWYSNRVSIVGTALASGFSANGAVSADASVNFANTIQWQGISDVRDSGGNLVAFSVDAPDTGIDWASPVVIPIPAAVWLFGSALGLLGWMRRKVS